MAVNVGGRWFTAYSATGRNGQLLAVPGISTCSGTSADHLASHSLPSKPLSCQQGLDFPPVPVTPSQNHLTPPSYH